MGVSLVSYAILFLVPVKCTGYHTLSYFDIDPVDAVTKLSERSTVSQAWRHIIDSNIFSVRPRSPNPCLLADKSLLYFVSPLCVAINQWACQNCTVCL